MADYEISAASTEYISYPLINPTVNGLPYDPTADVVQFGFVTAAPNTGTSPSTWVTGSWSTVTPAGSAASYVARCLIGPANSGNVLAVGQWWVWIKVTDNPEVPAKPVGTLTVY